MVLPVDDKPNEGRTSYGSNVVFATPEAWWQIKKRALSQVNQRVQRGRMPLPLQTRLEIHMAVAVTSFDRWGLCTYGILSSFCPLKNVSFTTVLPETVLSARNIVVWINNVTRSLSSFPGGQMVKTLYFHCRARRFCPWPESSTCHLARKKTRKQNPCSQWNFSKKVGKTDI